MPSAYRLCALPHCPLTRRHTSPRPNHIGRNICFTDMAFSSYFNRVLLHLTSLRLHWATRPEMLVDGDLSCKLGVLCAVHADSYLLWSIERQDVLEWELIYDFTICFQRERYFSYLAFFQCMIEFTAGLCLCMIMIWIPLS
jgi:hypothetical protein